jgi:hypothetical protein
MYPSVSAYWDVRKTLFADSDLVSSLRIEAGYGESGKDDTIPYEFLGDYSVYKYDLVEPSATPFFDARAYIHNKETNVSLTFGMFDDRLSVTAGYYNRQTVDKLSLYAKGEELLSEPPVSEEDPDADPGEGDDEPVFVPEHRFWQYKDREEVSQHKTEIRNEGVELSLTAVPVKSEDWTWSITANAAYNFSNIHRIHPADMGGMTVGSSLVATSNYEGFPVSSIVDEDGAVIGNPTPKWYGGLSTSLRWKDLTLDVLADGAAGHQILNLNQMYLNGATKVTGTYVENGDFFRIARVSLAYNIPVKNVKWMESLKVFATASNLATFTSYNGWSPDVNSYAASNFRLGMDYGSYPAARSFVLGLSVKF